MIVAVNNHVSVQGEQSKEDVHKLIATTTQELAEELIPRERCLLGHQDLLVMISEFCTNPPTHGYDVDICRQNLPDGSILIIARNVFKSPRKDRKKKGERGRGITIMKALAGKENFRIKREKQIVTSYLRIVPERIAA